SLPPAKRISAYENAGDLPSSEPSTSSVSSSQNGAHLKTSYQPDYLIPSSPHRKRKFDEELEEYIEVSRRLLSSENRIPFGRKSNSNNTSSPRAKRRLLRKYRSANGIPDNDSENL